MYVETWQGPPTPIMSRSNHQMSRVSSFHPDRHSANPNQSTTPIRTYRRPSPGSASTSPATVRVALNNLSVSRQTDSSMRGFSSLSRIPNFIHHNNS